MGNRQSLNRQMQIMAKKAGLDREDRLHLVRSVFETYQEIESLSELSDQDLEDLLWAMNVHRVVEALRLANGTTETQSRVLLDQLYGDTESADQADAG